MVKDDEYTTNADAALLQKVITTTTEIISDIANRREEVIRLVIMKYSFTLKCVRTL